MNLKIAMRASVWVLKERRSSSSHSNDIVVLDNLSAHKVPGVREAIIGGPRFRAASTGRTKF
jgi:hypothetical protein